MSADNLTVSFTEALEYEHLGETVDLGSGHQLEARAEVGMYSRNIIVRGSDNAEWHDEIEACEDGFDAGNLSSPGVYLEYISFVLIKAINKHYIIKQYPTFSSRSNSINNNRIISLLLIDNLCSFMTPV